MEKLQKKLHSTRSLKKKIKAIDEHLKLALIFARTRQFLHALPLPLINHERRSLTLCLPVSADFSLVVESFSRRNLSLG